MNGSVNELTLEGCNFACPYQDFRRLVQHVLPGDMTEECFNRTTLTRTADKPHGPATENPTQTINHYKIKNQRQGPHSENKSGFRRIISILLQQEALFVLIPLCALVGFYDLYKLVIIAVVHYDLYQRRRFDQLSFSRPPRPLERFFR